MEKKRFIFDLDGTLLTCDYKLEEAYFESVLGDKGIAFAGEVSSLLDIYERKYPKYDVEVLSEYLTHMSGLPVTPDVIRGWISIIGDAEDTMEDGVIETLEDLKLRGKELVVLTNWFEETQVSRLKHAGLYDYFDEVYTGEFFLKPKKAAYILAMNETPIDQCLMIGDSVDKDYIGPRACGMDSVLYDKNDIHHKTLVKVKNMNEIKDRY